MTQAATDSDLSVLESLDESIPCEIHSEHEAATHRFVLSCDDGFLICAKCADAARRMSELVGVGVCPRCKQVTSVKVIEPITA